MPGEGISEKVSVTVSDGPISIPDWTCPKCKLNNNYRNQNCHYCGTPKSSNS